MITALLKSLRPKQWTKNLLVFAGFLFTLNGTGQSHSILRVLAAFGLFCAISGATYIFNDAADVERDRQHPRKCKRPIASGAVPVKAAVVIAVLLVIAAVYVSFKLSFHFGLLAAGYLMLTSAYSASLKHIVIVDLFAIAAGFVLRAVAGAVVINVDISSWLLICTTLLALFLGLAKRRSEIITLEDGAFGHRKTLSEYNAPMLDQMLSITASAALMSYCLYTFTPLSKTGSSHPYMMMTVPFVVYGLFRYLLLVHTENAGGNPELVLLEDKPMLINIVLYVITAVVALKL